MEDSMNNEPVRFYAGIDDAPTAAGFDAAIEAYMEMQVNNCLTAQERFSDAAGEFFANVIASDTEARLDVRAFKDADVAWEQADRFVAVWGRQCVGLAHTLPGDTDDNLNRLANTVRSAIVRHMDISIDEYYLATIPRDGGAGQKTTRDS